MTATVSRGRSADPLSLIVMAVFLTGCLTSDQTHQPAAKLPSGPSVSAAAVTVDPAADWTLADLKNATPDTVHGLLGLPNFVRAEDPAQYWRFGDSTCALDVFLYADGAGEPRVRHAELRRQDEPSAAPASCLDHLRRTLVAETASEG